MNNFLINNPGNIRGTKRDKWLGQNGTSTAGFVIFESPFYGCRAMAKVLITYIAKHGLKTIAEIVTRWAPPSDGNNTEVYINIVSAEVKRNPNALLQKEDAYKLMAAMIKVEQGVIETNRWMNIERNRIDLGLAAQLLAREIRLKIEAKKEEK